MNKFIDRWLLIQAIAFIIQILITFSELLSLDSISALGCLMGFALISGHVGCLGSMFISAIEFICKIIYRL